MLRVLLRSQNKRCNSFEQQLRGIKRAPRRQPVILTQVPQDSKEEVLRVQMLQPVVSQVD